jgi:alcohol dehydrogenase class IV
LQSDIVELAAPKAIAAGLVRAFAFHSAPSRVLFGACRTAELAAEVERLGARRPIILTTAEQAPAGQSIASHHPAAQVFAGAVMHTPVDVTQRALDAVSELGADCLVAFGGGSAIGLGKALAARTGLPQIAIPTTYAGSEVTDILGETDGGVKVTRRGAEILPEVVIYDVDHTMTLPPRLSAASGLNAIAHAAEALYAHDGNPIISLMAREGVASLVKALPEIVANPGDREAREEAQYGAWLCGICLGSVSMALHHKLAHVLGGAFALPHAETHAVLLPYSLAYNAPSAPAGMMMLRDAMGSDAPWLALHNLARAMSLPHSLAAIGMPVDGVDRAVELALTNRYPNPRPLEAAPLRALLNAALVGRPPRSE